ncbi:MAG: alpha/beta hydrolase, partial [Fimbriimonas ginsengisoli]|nr:alpha/beta hydrolase [Fimbriimonas ginsengisoli]
RRKMKNLRVPVLICVGRWDRVAIPKASWEIKQLLPAETSHLRIFEKSGHRPWVEETDLYFKTVADFLADKLKD